MLTGLLGAGKTTLLNRLLRGDHGLKVAVLVNDFGAINIDAELVAGVAGNVVSLANGCICCSIRDDLVASVLEAIARPGRPECILLEASGVAEPASIAATFNNPALSPHIRLDGILCIVDAEQVFAVPEAMELKIFQVACADMVILNKVDLVGRAQVERIRGWLDARINRARVIEATRADVPLEVVLSVGRLGAGHGQEEHHPHDHAARFGTWSYESDRPLRLEALRAAASRLPGTIYRAKGVVRAVEAPERRAILQVVGRRVDIALDDEWGTRPPRTRIVAIGAAGAMDAAGLGAVFDRCV